MMYNRYVPDASGVYHAALADVIVAQHVKKRDSNAGNDLDLYLRVKPVIVQIPSSVQSEDIKKQINSKDRQISFEN